MVCAYTLAYTFSFFQSIQVYTLQYLGKYTKWSKYTLFEVESIQTFVLFHPLTYPPFTNP